jgi:hypothetical protein
VVSVFRFEDAQNKKMHRIDPKSANPLFGPMHQKIEPLVAALEV